MIFEKQKQIIEFANKFTLDNQNIYSEGRSYFAVFEKTLGYFLIKKKFNKFYFLSYALCLIKLFLNIKEVKLKIFNAQFATKNYRKIIVSWAFRDNFDKEGTYKDKFLNTKSDNDENNILWLLIYMDKELPARVGKNIVLIHKEKKLYQKLIFFLKYFFSTFKLKSFSSSIKKLNLLSATSMQIKEILEKNFTDISVQNLLVVYEGQPFQKEIINFFKNKDKKILIEGYDHSAPPPLPINLIYDDFSPDYLLITGEAQKNFYKKYLNWPENKLKIIKSMRFISNKSEFYQNKFFLPYELRDQNIIFSSLKYLLDHKINLKDMDIKIHPLQKNKKNHQSLVYKIKKIISTNSNDPLDSEQNNSIFFGQTTAVIIALDLGVTCYHICSDPVFDSYDSKIWEQINVTKLSNNLFKYTTNKKNSFLSNGKNYEI